MEVATTLLNRIYPYATLDISITCGGGYTASIEANTDKHFTELEGFSPSKEDVLDSKRSMTDVIILALIDVRKNLAILELESLLESKEIGERLKSALEEDEFEGIKRYCDLLDIPNSAQDSVISGYRGSLNMALTALQAALPRHTSVCVSVGADCVSINGCKTSVGGTATKIAGTAIDLYVRAREERSQ